MEARYSKLYDKYTKLKVKKASEAEQLSLDQEEKFKTYVSGQSYSSFEAVIKFF
ncbi:hypothetical protein HanOQP8_Chr14g0531401 [Helianthus annuus]|nr:hypothetical protein HanOQP8_Chr14g0531401 [Helianthus annuus]